MTETLPFPADETAPITDAPHQDAPHQDVLFAPPTASSRRSITWNPDHDLLQRRTLRGRGVPLLKPFWDWERTARVALYRPYVAHLCKTFEPPEDARFAWRDRRLWERDPELLITLRQYEWLGTLPSGKRAWVGDVLRGDLMQALQRRGKGRRSGSAWAGEPGGQSALMALMHYLRDQWGPHVGSDRCDLAGLKWGSPSSVQRMKRRGGEFTYYCWPGLSSPGFMLQTMISRMSGYSQRPSPAEMLRRARQHIRSLGQPYDLWPVS